MGLTHGMARMDTVAALAEAERIRAVRSEFRAIAAQFDGLARQAFRVIDAACPPASEVDDAADVAFHVGMGLVDGLGSLGSLAQRIADGPM